MQQVVILKRNQAKTVKLILDKYNQNKELYIFFVGRNKEQFSVSTISKHTKSSTRSRVVVRGVLFDQAKAKVEGMIEIGENVTGCDSHLDQKILLVGDKATADVRPQLEIKNNDVKASHAATVGKIDREQLFYLQTRGISEKQATDELVRGFFNQYTDALDHKMINSLLC